MSDLLIIGQTKSDGIGEPEKAALRPRTSGRGFRLPASRFRLRRGCETV